MHEYLHQKTDAGDSIRQRMQVFLYQTEDAGVSPSDSGCRRLSIRQRMQETLSDSGCRRLSIRQRMQEYLRQTANAGDSLSDCLIEKLLHLLTDRESPASAV